MLKTLKESELTYEMIILAEHMYTCTAVYIQTVTTNTSNSVHIAIMHQYL